MIKNINYINLISPAFLASLLTIFGIIMTFVPPYLYDDYVKEKDLMYGNWIFIAFVILCWISFILPALFIEKQLGRFSKEKHTTEKYAKSSVRAVILLACLSIVINIIAIFLYAQVLSFNGLIANVLGGSKGDEARLALAAALADNKLGWTEMFTYATFTSLLWLSWCKKTIIGKNYSLILFRLAISIGLLSVFRGLAVQSRGPVLAILIGAGVVWIYSQWRIGRLKTFRIFRLVLAFFILSVGIFSTLQYFRSSSVAGSNDTFVQSTITGVMGYFPASYNRAAGVIGNVLEYPNKGSFYNTLAWFWEFPFLSNSLKLNQFGRQVLDLNLPDSAFAYQASQFVKVGSQGFVPKYIWATIYGDLYGDLGWLTPIWFVGYGILAQFFWILFRRGNIIGIAVYPRIVVGITLWYAVVDISRRDTVVVILTALLLYLISAFLNRLSWRESV